MSGDTSTSGSAADTSGVWSGTYYDQFNFTSTYSYGSSGSGMMNGTLFNDTSTAGGGGPTCQQQLELGAPLPLSTTTAETMRYIQIVYYGINFPIALFLNAFVVYLVARYKTLHNITFYLALQITIVDLANAIIVYPTTLANVIAAQFVFRGLCSMLGVIVAFLRTARNLFMMVLVADRFCLIFLPFWYSRHRVKVTIPLSIAAGIISFIVTIIPANGILDCYGFQRVTWSCLMSPGCTNVVGCTTYRTFVVTSSNGAVFLAFLLYLALLFKAKKLQNKISISTSSENPEDREIEKRKRQRECQANTTILILFVALVGISFPAYLFFTFGKLTLNSLNIQPPPPGYIVIAIVAKSIFALVPVMDPIVIMRNQDVKKVLQQIFAKLKKKREMLVTSHTSQETLSSTNEIQNPLYEQDTQ